MTNEEAIEIIKSTPLLRYEDLTNTESDLGNALRMAIKALEKQEGCLVKKKYLNEAEKRTLIGWLDPRTHLLYLGYIAEDFLIGGGFKEIEDE